MSSSPDLPLHRSGQGLGLAFVILGLVALVLRAWNFFLLGLDHYDEGVYSLSGFWSLPSSTGVALYPFQKLFSPPGYFGLVGLAYWISGGASDSAAIAINILFGAATVLLAGWVGTRWFGRSCGIAAAALVALSDFDIAFARMALTDTMFAFLFLLSLALIAIALEKDRVVFALLAGLTAGVAWNVKYDGYFPVAIALAVIIFQAATKREERMKLKRALLLWGVMAGIAFALFLPWVIYTQVRLGGYFGVESFHQQFYTFAWAANFKQQLENQIYFEGFLSRISPLVAFLAALAVEDARVWSHWRFVCLAAAGLAACGLVLGGAGTCVVLALIGLAPSWRRGEVFGKLLVSGIAVLFLLIPCYTPFARLALPWTLLVQIAAGLGMQEIWNAAESRAFFASPSRSFAGALCLMSVLAVPMASGGFTFAKVDPWDSPPKDSMRRTVAAMSKLVPPGSIIFVDEEPDAAFYFRRAGYTTFCTMRLFNSSRVPDAFQESSTHGGAPIYVVAGPYAQLAPDWNPIPAEIRVRLSLVARFLTQPGDVRLLDDFPPQEALKYRAHPDDRYDLLLIRVGPPVAKPTADAPAHPAASNQAQ